MHPPMLYIDRLCVHTADPDWEESKTGIVRLPTISTHILELIVSLC